MLRFFTFLNRYQMFDHDVEKFLNQYAALANKKMPPEEQFQLFRDTFDFLKEDLPEGIIRGQQRTPTNLYEAAAVGTALVLMDQHAPRKGVLQSFLASDRLKSHTSAGSNTRKHVRSRIELVRDRLQP